jgi:hypothetical protein
VCPRAAFRAAEISGFSLVAGLAAKGVHLFGPVDEDPGHAVTDFIDEIFEFHEFSHPR